MPPMIGVTFGTDRLADQVDLGRLLVHPGTLRRPSVDPELPARDRRHSLPPAPQRSRTQEDRSARWLYGSGCGVAQTATRPVAGARRCDVAQALDGRAGVFVLKSRISQVHPGSEHDTTADRTDPDLLNPARRLGRRRPPRPGRGIRAACISSTSVPLLPRRVGSGRPRGATRSVCLRCQMSGVVESDDGPVPAAFGCPRRCRRWSDAGVEDGEGDTVGTTPDPSACTLPGQSATRA